MSCKSAIYTANTSVQTLAVGSEIDLGNIIRRFGSNVNLNGDAININGSGYYDVSASFTITGTNAGTVNIVLLKDGVAIPGAVASVVVAVGDVVTIPIKALVREFGCCYDNNSNLTFVLTGTAESITNASVVVERI